MRQRNGPTVNFGETPRESVSGKDSELVGSWSLKAEKNRMGNPGFFRTAQLSACLRMPECVYVRKNHVDAYLGVPIV